MENLTKDKITSDILCNSKLEIKNSDFNNIVMNKILLETRKPKIFYNGVLYLLIFLLLDTLIFVIFKLFNINIIIFSTETGSFVNDTIVNLCALKDLIFENSIIQYSIVALIVLKIFDKISSFGLKYSK